MVIFNTSFLPRILIGWTPSHGPTLTGCGTSNVDILLSTNQLRQLARKNESYLPISTLSKATIPCGWILLTNFGLWRLWTEFATGHETPIDLKEDIYISHASAALFSNPLRSGFLWCVSFVLWTTHNVVPFDNIFLVLWIYFGREFNRTTSWRNINSFDCMDDHYAEASIRIVSTTSHEQTMGICQRWPMFVSSSFSVSSK